MNNHNVQQDNQAIYELINDSYLQNFHQFITNSQNVNSTSTVSIHWFQYLMSNQNYRVKDQDKIIGINQNCEFVIPILRQWWIYVKQINLSKYVNQDICQNIKLQKIEQIKLKQSEKYKSKTNESQFIIIRNHKIYGKSQLINTYHLKDINTIYELRLFHQNGKIFNIFSNQMVYNQKQRFVNYFGVIFTLNTQNVNKLTTQNINNLAEPKQALARKINFTADTQPMLPIFANLQNLVYLKGFENKQFSVQFKQQLIQILNKKLMKIEGILNLGSQKIELIGLKFISQNKFQQLTYLNLWWNMIGQKGAQLLSQGSYPVLKILDLRKNYIGDSGLNYFNCIEKDQNNLIQNFKIKKCFPNLQKLILTDNNISSTQKLSVYTFPNLKQLQLQNNKFLINERSQKIYIPELHNLKILSLRNNLITGQGLHNIKMNNLQQLYLTNNCIVSCQGLIFAYLPSLKILNISKNKINSIKWLKKCLFCLQNNVQKKSGLQILDISDNLINQIAFLYQINWWKLKQFRLNSPYKKNDLIKHQDQINQLFSVFKWNLQKQNDLNSIKLKLYTHKNSINKNNKFTNRLWTNFIKIQQH